MRSFKETVYSWFVFWSERKRTHQLSVNNLSHKMLEKPDKVGKAIEELLEEGKIAQTGSYYTLINKAETNETNDQRAD